MKHSTRTYVLHELPLLGEQPLHASMLGTRSEKSPPFFMTVSDFPSAEIPGNSKNTPTADFDFWFLVT